MDNNRHLITSQTEPAKQDILWKEIWEKVLFQAGFTLDLSSNLKKSEVLHPDLWEGSRWWSGYYDRWFSSNTSSGYKEHSTMIGLSDDIGPIAISLMNFIGTKPSDGNLKALVRTELGFAIVQLELDKSTDPVNHVRGNSMTAALKKLKVNQLQLQHPPPGLLQRILETYFADIRKLHDCGGLNPYVSADSGLATGSASEEDLRQLEQTQVAYKMWGPKREPEFFDRLDCSKIAECLEPASFPSVNKRLSDMERRLRCEIYHVDVVNVSNSSQAIGKKEDDYWNSFLSLLGTEDVRADFASSSKKFFTSKNGDIARKNACITDFYEKEAAYVESLESVEKNLLIPAAKNSILSKRDISLLPRLKEIIQVNNELLATLKDAVRNDTIGKTLLPFGDKMEVYSSYVKSHEEKSRQFKHLLRENLQFKTFVEKCRKETFSTKLNFDDIFISPVQKIPRYCLVLSDLINFTPEDNPDMPFLKKSYARFAKLASFLNEGIDREKSQMATMELIHTLENCPPDLVKSYRFLVHKFEMFEADADGEQKDDKPMTMHLFNDCVVISRPKKSGKKNIGKFVAQYELSKLDAIYWNKPGFENVFHMEAQLSMDQKSKTIKLGESAQEGTDSTHTRTSSWQSSAASNNISKDSHKAFHLLKSNNATAIVKSIREWKYKLTDHGKMSMNTRKFKYQADVNTDIYYSVYPNLDAYRKAQARNSVLVMFSDESAKTPYLTNFPDVKSISVIKYGLGGVRMFTRSEELPLEELTSATSNDRTTLETEDTDVVSQLVMLCKIADEYEPTSRSKAIEWYRTELSKIVSSNITKQTLKSNYSAQSLSPFKTLGRYKSTSISRSRRGSAMSIFNDSEEQPSGMFAGGSIKGDVKRRGSLSNIKLLFRAKTSHLDVMNLICSHLEDSCIDTAGLYTPANAKKAEFLLSNIEDGKLTPEVLLRYCSFDAASALLLWSKRHSTEIWCLNSIATAEQYLSILEEAPEAISSCTSRLIKHLHIAVDNQKNPDLVVSLWADALLTAVEPCDRLGKMKAILATIPKPKKTVIATSLDTSLNNPLHIDSRRSSDRRRSLDALNPARRKSAPPLALNSGISLHSIKEVSVTAPSDGSVLSILRTSSLRSSFNNEDEEVEPVDIPSRKSSHGRQGTSRSIPRKPVLVKEPPVSISPSLSVRTPKLLSRQNSRKDDADGVASPAESTRRSFSMPAGEKALKDMLAKIVEFGDRDMKAECAKMTSEVENLKVQLKCMKQALEAEIRKKDSTIQQPKSVSWDSMEESLSNIFQISSTQFKTSSEAFDYMKAEIERLKRLNEKADLEIGKLKSRIRDMESVNDSHLTLVDQQDE